MASPQLALVVEGIRAGQLDFDAPVAGMRAAFEQGAGAIPLPPDVHREPANTGGAPGEWISIDGAAAEATLLYLHGGGYVIGSVNTHREAVARIARAANGRALSLDYRLAPEHPFPAAVDDATAAYRWLLVQGDDPRTIVIAGDSAGGGLAAATLLALRDAGDPLPAAAVLLSPWLDLACTGASMKANAAADPILSRERLLRWAAHYLNGADARTPLASPLYGDLAGLPPLLLQAGTAETLQDDSVRFAERAQAAGVDATLELWDEMIHVWHLFALMLPEGQQAIDRVGAWVRERVG